MLSGKNVAETKQQNMIKVKLCEIRTVTEWTCCQLVGVCVCVDTEEVLIGE